jgi:hypothetical protein
MDYSDALARLKEMFPKHPTTAIDRALRENRGALHPTITQLLRSAPDSKARPPHPKTSNPAAKHRPLPNHDPTADHIFHPDFLRLPPDVEWVKIKVDSSGSSPLQTDDDIMLPSLRKDPHAEMRSLTDSPSQTLQLGPADPKHQESGWAKLKSRFLGLNPQYSQI